jgi:putative membrane protein insertion efficiency factor
MIKRLFIAAIRLYQATLSPDHGILRKRHGFCRFYPTCSQYAVEAIEKYGVLRGTTRAALRVARCNPFTKPGIDTV